MKTAEIKPHTVPITDVIVGNRHRHDLGNIADLAHSIEELGLIHPVVVRPDSTLIIGVRRLAACRYLGWEEVPVTVLDLEQIVRGEFAENAYRKAFLPSEIYEILRELEPLEKAAAQERQRATQFGNGGGKFPSPSGVKGKSRDHMARLVGISGRTLDKIKAVIDAAESDPERFGRLLVEMDRSGKVDRSYYELKRIQVEEAEAIPITEGLEAKIITGDFRKQGHLIDDNSVDLIFTDLPYHRKAIPLYADLAKFAARVLIEGGSLICYCGHYAIPDILKLMEPHLRYWWMIACVHTGRNKILRAFGVHVGWKPMLWFTKGPRRTKIVVGDCVRSERGNKLTDHPWAQGTSEATYYIQWLSRKGSLICDPFLGGATTAVSALKLGRGFVGFEIDPAVARKAEAKIAQLRTTW